jgi:hypothetical protein
VVQGARALFTDCQGPGTKTARGVLGHRRPRYSTVRMSLRRRPWIPLLAASVLLGACGPVHSPPAGYEATCYGGNYRKTYVNSVTFVTFIVQAPERDWARLSELLASYGRAQGVTVFDTSLIRDNVHYFGVSLCDAEGLFLYASKQNWVTSDTYDPRPGSVEILVSAYANHDRWRSFAESFAKHLEDSWSGAVAVSWQPAPAAAPPSTAR